MPIYEYQCQKCEQHFEEMVPHVDEADDVRCPHCGTEKVSRLLSLFGVGQAKAGDRAASGMATNHGCGCGGCTCGQG